ncbi:hypothetical protein Tco_0332415 [Tanacetum coccineum]
MFINVDQLEKQLNKEEFQEIGSIAAFKVLETQFQMFIKSRIYLDDKYVIMTHKYFLKYTQLEIREFRDTLIQRMESVKKSIDKRALHKREYDSKISDHYDEEPMVIERKKQKWESGRNSRPSVMPSARSQSTANGSKPKPRINNQKSRNWPASKTSYVTTKTVPIAEHSRNSRNFSDSKYFVCSTCQKCVFNTNHDSCVTKFLNEVNSRAKVPSHKTTNRNKPVKQVNVAKKPERHTLIGHRFSIKKTSVVHEKTKTPRSCLRWKPTGRILKTIGLRWVPTGKIFTSSTTTVNSEPPHGSNTDITNLLECIQTLDSNAGTSINIQEEQTLDLNAGTLFNLKKD